MTSRCSVHSRYLQLPPACKRVGLGCWSDCNYIYSFKKSFVNSFLMFPSYMQVASISSCFSCFMALISPVVFPLNPASSILPTGLNAAKTGHNKYIRIVQSFQSKTKGLLVAKFLRNVLCCFKILTMACGATSQVGFLHLAIDDACRDIGSMVTWLGASWCGILSSFKSRATSCALLPLSRNLGHGEPIQEP